MFVQLLTIIVPIFFVLLLGYAAGRARAFDSDQVAGINELAFDFAVPASLFVGMVSTPRAQLLQQGPLFLALLLSFVGLYGVVFILGRLLFRHRMADAALQAIMVSYAAGPFFGSALLSGVYGASSAIGIGLLALILNFIVVPTTLVLLGISQAPAHAGTPSSLGSLITPALVNAIKTPLVWAPLLAITLVLSGVSMPHLLDATLALIGQSASGVALFVVGLTIAARTISLNLEVGVNTFLKMVAQPALFLLLAVALGIKQPYGHEGFLLTALPSGPIGVLLSTRYKTYESEASSTLALTTLSLLLTLPIALYLIGGA
jgi:malonate transporter and related proteins